MAMKLAGWGRYPYVDTEPYQPGTSTDVVEVLQNHGFRSEGARIRDTQGEITNGLIARGLGRSYGDSSLAPHVVDTTLLNGFISFDAHNGLLRCAAGVSLAEILDVFVPQGWFLPVSPGTKFVTVGGAIASDVHGKNHHLEGTFGEHVAEMNVVTAAAGVVSCSPTDNVELFRATCGGMGLTGIIVDAAFKLKPIESAYIDQTTIKATNLEEALSLFVEHSTTTYSVAWIDCLARGRSLGRSLLTVGEHATSGSLESGTGRKLDVPIELPNMILNRHSVQAFNTLYYNRVRKQYSETKVHYETFFYPLDGLHNWNRIYGPSGFTQYQFVIPREGGIEGLTEVLDRIAESKRASFLAVLKTFGPENENYISFPHEGYTLALDFKLDDGLFQFLDVLDEIVLRYGGRLYLSKDVRMSPETFRAGYPRWPMLAETRRRYGADQLFNSIQSERLGI